jgi:hypothetical protein
MKVKARDGKTYDVTTAPPGGEHEVYFEKKLMGTFKLLPTETKVSVRSNGMTEILLVDIADRFVAQGGGPMGMA